ncbi:hypothetical protein PoB_003194900 [Plakobranchus ocellatus]|uniref:Uncharacterized protein n=1 Tax=Plakobranchus ocellatus TaxID=259542 RepID=A0AAV4AGS4_9GAST|nr:hypothetical protein PoB_003194900 [Plakobranchus ocellatus]
MDLILGPFLAMNWPAILQKNWQPWTPWTGASDHRRIKRKNNNINIDGLVDVVVVVVVNGERKRGQYKTRHGGGGAERPGLKFTRQYRKTSVERRVLLHYLSLMR